MRVKSYLAVRAFTVAEPILSPRLATGHGVAGQAVGPEPLQCIYLVGVAAATATEELCEGGEDGAEDLAQDGAHVVVGCVVGLWCDSGCLSGVEWSWERVRSATGC